MVKVGRRFFFNQSFQKKQRRLTIFFIIGILTVIIITFSITSRFHDKSGEKATLNYVLKQEYDVEIFSVMPSFLNYFEKIENVPLNSIGIYYDDNFTYDENGDNCSEEQLDIIKKIRNGQVKAEDYTQPFACLNFVPNKVGSYNVKIVINNQENNMVLNVIDSVAPEFEVKDLTITNEETYKAEDFVTECQDNSKTECTYDFYVPLRGERIDYSNYKEPGEYEIKVVAKDLSNNTSEPKTAKLSISEVHYYTITFNSNGGPAVENQTIKEGEKVYSPYISRDGYSLDGWYNGNSKYDFNNPVSSNLNLTAKWKSINSGGSGNSGGYSGGSGSSSGSGGKSSSGCQYGKYSDYSGEVSIYANLVTGKSLNDCAEKANGEDNNYNELYQIVMDIAYDLIKQNKGAIDLDFKKIVGSNASVNHHINVVQVVNSHGFIGLLVTIDSSSKGYELTYTLYNCTVSSCKWR